jgi:hypothetical protein
MAPAVLEHPGAWPTTNGGWIDMTTVASNPRTRTDLAALADLIADTVIIEQNHELYFELREAASQIVPLITKARQCCREVDKALAFVGIEHGPGVELVHAMTRTGRIRELLEDLTAVLTGNLDDDDIDDDCPGCATQRSAGGPIMIEVPAALAARRDALIEFFDALAPIIRDRAIETQAVIATLEQLETAAAGPVLAYDETTYQHTSRLSGSARLHDAARWAIEGFQIPAPVSS